MSILRSIRDFLDRNNLLPRFAEDSIFLILIALSIVLFIDPASHRDLIELLRQSEKATAIIIIGAVITIYTAIYTRFKTETQKHYMIWFALLVNVFIGLSSFVTITSKNLGGLWYVLPSINILIFIIVIIFWYTGLYNTERLSTKSMSLGSVIYGSLALFFISITYKFFFGPNWQVLFSASVSYASLFNRTITKHLPVLFLKSENRISTTENLIDKVVYQAINKCNESGLFFNEGVLVSENFTKIITIPTDKLTDANKYLDELSLNDYRHDNIAIAMAGSYSWKQFLWSNVKNYEALIVEVYLANDKRKYSFCQTIDNDLGDYKTNERGLIYQGSSLIKC